MTDRILIRLNPNVSATFVGLTAAGYALASFAESDRLAGIRAAILNAFWSPETLAYFGNARTASCAVNPYWPRAFLIILASLYLPEQPPLSLKAGEVAAHIADLDMISPLEKDPAVIDWVIRLAGHLEKVRSNMAFPGIWQALQDDFTSRRAGYEQALSGTVDHLQMRLGVEPVDLPPITVIVNRLGARQADDFAVVRGTTYAITADPDPTGILHELLHDLLGPRIKGARELIQAHRRLLGPILSRMTALQYAWNDGPESWDRVFEEHMMRAVSLWVACGDDPAAERRATQFAQDGFAYVPVFLEKLRCGWQGLDDFERFVSDCLEACESGVET